MTGPNAPNVSSATLTKSGAASAANPIIAVTSPSTLSPYSALLIDSASIYGSSSDGLDRDVIPNFPHIFAKDVGPAGTGLFTSKSLGPGELVLKDTRPLGCVLNTPLLEHRCAWCLTGPSLTHMKDQEHICLKKCGGCSVVRFCNQVGGFPFFATRFCWALEIWKDFSIHSFLAVQSRYWVGPGLPLLSKKFPDLEVLQLSEQCRGLLVSRTVWSIYRLKSRVHAHPIKHRHEQRS